MPQQAFNFQLIVVQFPTIFTVGWILNWEHSVKQAFVDWKARWQQRLTRPSFKEASKEVAITVGTATLPIWFFPLMGLFLFNPSISLHLLEHSVSNGELFLFATSLVGPLIYILFRVYDP